VPGERRHRALAVRAGDAEHRRLVVPGEQLDVAEHRDVLRHGLTEDFFFQGKARADAHHVDIVEQARSEGPGVQIAREVLGPRRRLPAVGDAHLAALARGPARHRKPGVAQAEDEHAPADQRRRRRAGKVPEGGLAHHRSLSVDRPKSTSIMVMIQKRTTTWLSFQPSSS
jgi:hypothetical protein